MTDNRWRSLLAQIPTPAERVALTGEAEGLPSRLPVADTAIACVAAALAAATALWRERTGTEPPPPRLAAEHVVRAVRSEAYLRVAGEPLAGFAPLSRFWRTEDGWVRTHANYPWHRDALLRALDTDPEGVARVIGASRAVEVETAVVSAGGVAAAMRTARQWHEHPQGRAVADRPLVAAAVLGDAPPRRHPTPALPASGLRVLDLTRVIAGPVATRYLAALGAEVLRVDPPHRPELPLHRYDGLPGKRSTVLDASTVEGNRVLHELLHGADVLVHGYRPGALAGFGLDSATLADRHPGLVTVTLSAWGSTGPWGDRRGFDSLVQAASGIAVVESHDGEEPGALPCQLLDHGTGYLAAAAALDGVRQQRRSGGSHGYELSLARTARWLLDQPRTVRQGARDDSAVASELLTTLRSDDGPVTMVTPPGAFGSTVLSWPDRLTGYANDPPRW